MVEHMECPRAFLGKLVPEHFFFPVKDRPALKPPPSPPPAVLPRPPSPSLQDMDHAAITAALEACVLTDAEMAAYEATFPAADLPFKVIEDPATGTISISMPSFLAETCSEAITAALEQCALPDDEPTAGAGGGAESGGGGGAGAVDDLVAAVIEDAAATLAAALADGELGPGGLAAAVAAAQAAAGLAAEDRVRILYGVLSRQMAALPVAAVVEKFEAALDATVKRTVRATALQKRLLACVERHLGAAEPALLKKTPVLLKALYDIDVLEEDVIAAWHAGPSPGPSSLPGVTAEAAAAVKAKASAFVAWLAEADEESDEESDDDES